MPLSRRNEEPQQAPRLSQSQQPDPVPGWLAEVERMLGLVVRMMVIARAQGRLDWRRTERSTWTDEHTMHLVEAAGPVWVEYGPEAVEGAIQRAAARVAEPGSYTPPPSVQDAVLADYYQWARETLREVLEPLPAPPPQTEPQSAMLCTICGQAVSPGIEVLDHAESHVLGVLSEDGKGSFFTFDCCGNQERWPAAVAAAAALMLHWEDKHGLRAFG
jgi:hypothetical protein